MKINKKKFLMRLIAFPLKLFFQVLWGILLSILISFKWMINGGQELYFGNEHGSGLVKLIEQNEEIIKLYHEHTKNK